MFTRFLLSFATLVSVCSVLIAIVTNSQPALTQDTCQLSDISRQFDFLTVERQIGVCSQDALITAIETDKPNVSGETLGYYEFVLGLAYASKSDNYNARIALGRAQVQYDNVKNHVMRAVVRYHFGQARAAESRLDDAFAFYGQAETIARQHNVTLILGRVLLEYGKRQEAEGQLDDMMKTMEDALDNLLRHPLDTRDEQLIALQSLSRAYTSFEFWERGALYSQMAAAVNQVDMSFTLRSFDAGPCQIADPVTFTAYISFERGLPACLASLIAWSEELEALRITATAAADRGRLGMLRGLVLEALGGQDNLFEAQRSFERALGQFREAGDDEAAALASLYLARNYYTRGQYPQAEQFYGPLANNSNIDPHTRGRAQYGLALLQYERDELQNAALTLQGARTSLLTAGDSTLPDQFEVLLLLTQIYGEQRDTTNAREANQLLSAVEQSLFADTGDELLGNNLCNTPNALFARSIDEVERNFGGCTAQSNGALALGSRIVKLNTRRAIERGRAQFFIGLAHYFARDYLEASPKLSSSLPDLNVANDSLTIALVNYYLSDTFLQGFGPAERAQSDTYLQSALNIVTELDDKYYMARLQLEQGRRLFASSSPNLPAAAAIVETAYQNFRISPVATCDDQRQTLDLLIDLYSSKNLGNEIKRQDFIQQRAACDVSNTTQRLSTATQPAGTVIATSTPVPESVAVVDCSTDIVLVVEDLLETDERLSQCATALDSLLQAAQTREAQATSSGNNEDIAHARIRLGLVNYYQGRGGQQGRYGEAVTRFEQAFSRFRDLGDDVNHGLAMFYIVRAQIAQISDADWARVRSDPSYRPAPLNPVVDYIAEVRRISARGGDTLTLARLEALVANVEYLSGRQTSALDAYSKALELFRQNQITREGVDVRLRVAQIREELSEFELVSQLYEEVLTLPENQVLPDQRALAGIGLAQQHKYFGRYEVATQLADEALANALDPVIRILARGEQADIAREAGNLQRASEIVTLYDNELEQLPRCQDADRLRLYTGYYYVSLGNASQAKVIFNDIIVTDCVGRTALDIARAKGGLADAELTRRSGDAQTKIAIGNANGDFDLLRYQPGYLSARIQQARYHRIRREWPEVERWLSAAEDRAGQLGDLRGLVDVMMLRVDVSIDRGLYTGALEQLAEATTLYAQMGHTRGLNNTIESRLRIYVDQANFVQAFEVLAEAQQVNANLSFGSRVNYYEGRLQELQGLTEFALASYAAASTGFASLGEVLNQIEVDLRIAGIYQQRGEMDRAETLVARALEIAISQENPFYIGQAQAFDANLKVSRWAATFNPDLNDPLLLQAATSFRQALTAYEESFNLTGQADVYTRLGELGLLQQETSGTFNAEIGGPTVNLGRALDLYRRIGNSIGQARVHNNQGRYFGLVRNYQEAHNNFNEALNVLGDRDPYLQADILTRQGVIYEYQHYAQQQIGVNPTDFLRRARANYERATELLSFTYAEIGSNEAQRSFGTRVETVLPYSRLVRILSTYNFEMDNIEQTRLVLRYSEQSRARSYLTALQDADVNLSQQLESQDPALATWFTLRDEIISLTRQLNDLRATAGDEAETANLLSEIDKRFAELEQIEGRIQEDSLRQLIGVNVTSLEDLQAVLPADTVLLSYYIVEGLRTPALTETARVVISVIGQNRAETFAVRVEDFDRDLTAAIDVLHRQRGIVLGGQTNWVQILHSLLIQPIQEVIDDYDHLILVPHSQLNYIAFEQLAGQDARTLLETHVVSYVPSVTVYTLLSDLQQQTATTQLATLILAYAGTAQGLEDLPNLDDEVASIRNVVDNAITYEFDEGNASNLRASLSEADVIHFASHGVFDQQQPLESYLALAPDGINSDGKLTVTDIYALSLSTRNPLVTLSACQLAFSAVSTGDELEGMIRAFLISGARGVVASLWYADDASTAKLMARFYANRAAGMTDAQALSDAKRMIAQQYPGEPNLWAGFILIGGN